MKKGIKNKNVKAKKITNRTVNRIVIGSKKRKKNKA